MPKPFDATLKNLAAVNPVEVLSELDRKPALPVKLLNVDLSTVTTATDIVFGLGDPPQEVIHVDNQSGPDAKKHRDLLAYNALLHRQYGVPVHSILLLLRRQAQHSDQTGNINYAARPGRGKMSFDYEIVRLWEKPVDLVLAGGLATLPLAPLCCLPEGEDLVDSLRRVLNAVYDRLQREAAPGMVTRLFTATLELTNLRVDRKQARALIEGVSAVEESPIYQAILDIGFDKGRIDELQQTLLRQGRRKFKVLDESTRQAVLAINDLERLHQLSERLLDVDTWQDLLKSP
jgi:hypothetical protein